MTLPYAEPLTVIDPADLVVPEPPRRGEEGGEPCFPCSADSDSNLIWSDQTWTLHNPGQTGLPGSVWLASRAHFDSFADMPADVATTFGGVCGRVERAVLALGDVGRVHVYRWGDGGAHFHVWFVPASARPPRHERPPADGVGGRPAAGDRRADRGGGPPDRHRDGVARCRP